MRQFWNAVQLKLTNEEYASVESETGRPAAGHGAHGEGPHAEHREVEAHRAEEVGARQWAGGKSRGSGGDNAVGYFTSGRGGRGLGVAEVLELRPVSGHPGLHQEHHAELRPLERPRPSLPAPTHMEKM